MDLANADARQWWTAPDILDLATDQSLAPAEGGRGMAMNNNPGFYADEDALLDSLRIHVHVAYDHLVGQAALPDM